MTHSVNLILCGVGGQNVLRAGELLSLAAMHSGYDVRMSSARFEELGGESVCCHVRWGQTVYSPKIREGEADFILSFERMETLRHLHMGKKGVAIIMNDLKIMPLTSVEYPEDVDSIIRDVHGSFHLIPAKSIVPDESLLPLVMLGTFAAFNQCSYEGWMKAIEEWAEGDAEPFIAAFDKGHEFANEPLRVDVALREDEPEPTDAKGIRTFDEMMERVRTLPSRRVAIAGALNEAALYAGMEALELGLATPVYVGPKDAVIAFSRQTYPDFDIERVEIVDAGNETDIAQKAVSLVRNGEADILLKGGVNTPTLMRAVLSNTVGLRGGGLISDTFVFEYPDENGKRLVMITDGGVTLQPTIQQKVEILKNAVIVAHALGNTMPRVAILAASETINPNVAATMDAAVLTKMNRTGQIPGCIVEGPIALDVAVSRKAAAIKGTISDVAGQADILVTANIDTANALAKSTTYFAGYRLSHVIVGGTAPILIASRSDTADAKLLSIALGSLMAKWFEEQREENVPVITDHPS